MASSRVRLFGVGVLLIGACSDPDQSTTTDPTGSGPGSTTTATTDPDTVTTDGSSSGTGPGGSGTRGSEETGPPADSTGPTRPVCGNGEPEDGEECDDGNGEDHDECPTTCCGGGGGGGCGVSNEEFCANCQPGADVYGCSVPSTNDRVCAIDEPTAAGLCPPGSTAKLLAECHHDHPGNGGPGGGRPGGGDGDGSPPPGADESAGAAAPSRKP